MIQLATRLSIVDNSGVLRARCIKIYGKKWKNIGNLGNVILGVVEHYTLKKGFLVDEKKRHLYTGGTMHKILIVRTKVNFKRMDGVYIKFKNNAGILINDRKIPIAKRVKGPLLIELGNVYPGILSICEEIV